jgi:hypothetical protein
VSDFPLFSAIAVLSTNTLDNFGSLCWIEGEIVADPYLFQLPADLPPDAYSLLVGRYDAADGARLQTAGRQDAFRLVESLAIGDE